jgi:hypothetical protein
MLSWGRAFVRIGMRHLASRGLLMDLMVPSICITESSVQDTEGDRLNV